MATDAAAQEPGQVDAQTPARARAAAQAGAPAPDSHPVSADDLVEAIGVVRRQVRRSAGRPWQNRELTNTQAELVRLLRRRRDLAVAEAARELGLAPNSVSTLVRQLADQGLVVRDSDVADRRIARLNLAPDARTAVEEWRDRRLTVLGTALEAISEADRQSLAGAIPALRRLAEQLHASELQSAGPRSDQRVAGREHQ